MYVRFFHNKQLLQNQRTLVIGAVCQKTGENVTEHQLHEILSEVDINKNAEVDIHEFLLVVFTCTLHFKASFCMPVSVFCVIELQQLTVFT